MNTEINKKKGRLMSRKYKEIYDDKFLESIPEKYREAFGNLELSDYKYMIDIDKVLEVFEIKMKWLIIDVPDIFEDENKTILFGNSTQEREIRRFNQAKGIGYSLIKSRDLSDIKPEYREIFWGIDDKFAEQFAKDLLMPEKLLIKTIEGAAQFVFHVVSLFLSPLLLKCVCVTCQYRTLNQCQLIHNARNIRLDPSNS